MLSSSKPRCRLPRIWRCSDDTAGDRSRVLEGSGRRVEPAGPVVVVGAEMIVLKEDRGCCGVGGWSEADGVDEGCWGVESATSNCYSLLRAGNTRSLTKRWIIQVIHRSDAGDRCGIPCQGRCRGWRGVDYGSESGPGSRLKRECGNESESDVVNKLEVE